MKQRKLILTSALFAAGALALTACGGGSSSSSSSGSGSSGAKGGSVTIYNVKPQNPLIPTDTNEVGGSNVLDNLFTGLVRYDPTTAAPILSAAESITPSKKSEFWDIKLKPGQMFQDNTPVTASSFVDAWNWGAYAPNAQLNSSFFTPIKGYDDLNPADPDGDGPKTAPVPKVKTMSGLKVISPTEFTIEFKTPQSFFRVEAGYAAFFPLPTSFYKDPAAFGKKPIGNGPFQLVSGDGSTGFVLKAWAGYQGADKPSITQATFKTYTSDTAAYADIQAGNLDFMDEVPPGDLVNDQFKKDMPGRFISKPVGLIGTLTMPSYDKDYQDPILHKAISMAIDRATITKSVFNGSYIPATGWVSPVVDGYKAGACGVNCDYNPTMAKQLFAQAKFKGPFTISYNGDRTGNKEAYEAICHNIQNNLGASCTAKPYVDFATFRAAVTSYKMTGMFRTAWQMDYPSIQDYLEPLYVTNASSNDGKYSNKTFDSLITKADGQSGAAANATYQQAEATLATDMSIVPLWYENQSAVWSSRVTNVKTTPFSTIDLTDIKVK